MNYKITKKELLKDVNNEMTTYKQYLVHFKVYNEEKTKYRKFKYVQLIYHDDLFEYAEKDYLSLKEQAQITNEIININVESLLYEFLQNYEDLDGIKGLIKFCNTSIRNYNKSNGFSIF